MESRKFNYSNTIIHHARNQVGTYPIIPYSSGIKPITLSVPRELATTWVTCSSIWLVQVAPNCSAVCHSGWSWGLASPTGNILLKTIRQPAKIFRCSAPKIFLTSTSSKDWCAKKSWCIRSITCWRQDKHIRDENYSIKISRIIIVALPPKMRPMFPLQVSHHGQSQEGKDPKAQTDVCYRENRYICITLY